MTEESIKKFNYEFERAWKKVLIDEGLVVYTRYNIPYLSEIKTTEQRVNKDGITMIITPVNFSNFYLVREKFDRKYLHENKPSEMCFGDTCVYLKDGTFLGYLRDKSDGKIITLDGETEEMNKELVDNATNDIIKDMKSVDSNFIFKNLIKKVVCLEPEIINKHQEIFDGGYDFYYQHAFGLNFYNSCVDYMGEVFNKVASHLKNIDKPVKSSEEQIKYNVGLDKPVESDEQELFMSKVEEKTGTIKRTISDPDYIKGYSEEGLAALH